MIFQDFGAFSASGFRPVVGIIGSGPAGIMVARKLQEAAIPCVVFEAGAEEFTEDSQDVYKGRTIGDPYFDLDATRLRFMGGSSNHWAGWCRFLEKHDFEAKAWVPNSGWPISRADIEPFFPEAMKVLGIPQIIETHRFSDRFNWFNVVKTDPVRFGPAYRDWFDASQTTALVLNTSVLELEGDGAKVTGARLWSNGAVSDFKVDQYVVATGGLENSRLLLWSNARSNGGVVPNARALGRYWMEHPMYWCGNAFVTDEAAFELDFESQAFFMPSPEVLEAEQIMNCHVQIETHPFDGVKGFVAAAACEAPETTEWVASMLGSHLQCSARVHMDWEQPPRETNHVALSQSERDAHGIPRIELHWKKDEMDRRTMLTAMRLFAEDVARRDVARVRISDWVLNGEFYPDGMELAGNHHMGGTRMGTDPATSVVDARHRVHGMANLHVAGSSVFATSGQCTPTTTIVAMSLRLGSLLADEISHGSAYASKS